MLHGSCVYQQRMKIVVLGGLSMDKMAKQARTMPAIHDASPRTAPHVCSMIAPLQQRTHDRSIDRCACVWHGFDRSPFPSSRRHGCHSPCSSVAEVGIASDRLLPPLLAYDRPSVVVTVVVGVHVRWCIHNGRDAREGRPACTWPSRRGAPPPRARAPCRRGPACATVPPARPRPRD